jgi:hypothetical protein
MVLLLMEVLTAILQVVINFFATMVLGKIKVPVVSATLNLPVIPQLNPPILLAALVGHATQIVKHPNQLWRCSTTVGVTAKQNGSKKQVAVAQEALPKVRAATDNQLPLLQLVPVLLRQDRHVFLAQIAPMEMAAHAQVLAQNVATGIKAVPTKLVPALHQLRYAIPAI